MEKFTIHQSGVDQPVGFVYENDEAGALEVVRTTWNLPEATDASVDEVQLGVRVGAALVVGNDLYIAKAVEETPERVSLAALETDSDAFADLVETAWWELMQGELLLVAPDGDDRATDRETRELVERLAGHGVETILATADALDQMDQNGEPLPDNYVSPEELARRVAAALAVVFYGGGS